MQAYPIISGSLGCMCMCMHMDASSSLWHSAKAVGIMTGTDQVLVFTETLHRAPVSSALPGSIFPSLSLLQFHCSSNMSDWASMGGI